jgi:hypothetical protein
MVKVVADGDNKGKTGTISGIKEDRSSTDTIEDDGTEVRKSKETKTVTVDLDGGGTYTTDSCKTDLNYHEPGEKSSSVFAFNPFSKQALREIERPGVAQRFGEGAVKGTLGGGLVGAGIGTAHGLYARSKMKEGPFGEFFGDPTTQRKILLQSILHGARGGAGLGGLGMGLGQAAFGARARPGTREISQKDLAARPGELPSATKKTPPKSEDTSKDKSETKQALREIEDRGLMERLGAGATQGGIGGAVGGAGLGAIGGSLLKLPDEGDVSTGDRIRRALAGAGVGGVLGGGVGAASGAAGEGAFGHRTKLGDELELQTGKRTPKPHKALGGIGQTIGSGLETIGGGSMRGLGSVLGKLGLGGAQSKLDEWAGDPTTSKWVGGGVTAAGTLAAALLAKKLMSRGEEDYDDDLYAEAAFQGAPPMQKRALGALIGGAYGAMRDKDPHERRRDAVIRSGATGHLTGLGAGLGAGLGGLGGAALAEGLDAGSNQKALAAVLGAMLGGGVGGGAAYSLSRREKPKERRGRLSEEKKTEDEKRKAREAAAESEKKSSVALSVKHAIFGGGSAASPVHKEENKAAKGGSDWRRGLTQRSGHRQTHHDRTSNWSLGR